ncbi:DUF4365 domain-containing protein [Armatimonas sp.]|uniref:DUF4365 domain-containing protein n=1 Tax=Armatimonas sp. TaxID=1872638 RepID=UPI00374D62F8
MSHSDSPCLPFLAAAYSGCGPRQREHYAAPCSALSEASNKICCALPIERKHLWTWSRELSPIILILYNASEERAYWLQLTRTRLRALAQTNQATCTVHLPTVQVFDAVAVETIRKIKNDLVAFYERQTTDG